MLKRNDINFGSKQRALITAALDQIRCLANTAVVTGQATPTHPAPTGSHAAAPDIPGYQLIQEIHRGGQGIVYEAIQASTQRRVAIKVIREGPLAAHHEQVRFEREVQILTQLKHPHIVTVFDSGAADQWAYFVMDFIPGEPIDDHVRKHQLSVSDCVSLFQQVCDAVNAAHVRGIIHRDLKPSNTRIGTDGTAHVLDFGLAKFSLTHHVSGELTETGQFLGSLPWASPEQADGHSRLVDVRTDVYALGIILYQLLTGTFPYSISGSLRQTIENITTAEPTPPRVHQPRLDRDLASIVLKCLRKHPDDRYQTAGELRRDLQRYREGRPIEARRDNTGYLIRKTLRRHWLSATLVVLVVATVVAVGVGSGVMYAREAALRVESQQARAEAERQAQVASAVNDFLNNDLLKAAQPQERGRDVTVLEVVNLASQSLQGRFERQPRIAAQLHDTLGNTYMKLAKWHSAVRHAEQALDLRRQVLGQEAEETLSSMNLVGRLYRRLGRLVEAEKIYEEMIPLAQVALGGEHDLTLKGMNNQAYVLYSRGKLQRAYDVNEQVLETRRRILGPEDEQTLTSINNHAYYAHALARNDEAQHQYEYVYEVRSRQLGPEHPATLLSMHNVATMLEEAGAWSAAERMQKQHLELVRRVQGAEHEHTMQAHSLLASIARKQGRWKEAEQHLQRAMKIQRHLGGEEHHVMAQHLADLAALRHDQGRLEDAEMLYLRAMQLTQRTLGDDHVRSYRQQLNLGKFYLDQSAFGDARPLVTAALQGLLTHYGPDHPCVREATIQLACLEESVGN